MTVDLTRAPQTSPLSLYRYRDGIYAADLLTAAIVEFDLFTWLEGRPATFAEICLHYGWHVRPADVLLTLLVARGYLRHAEGRYHVTHTAREHLCAGSPWSLAPYFAALRERPFVADFVRVLGTGRPAGWGGAASGDWHEAMRDDAFARRFTEAMDCRGLYLGEALSRALDLSGYRRVLDVGGGSGIYACALVARQPHLTATVADQPAVVPVATALVAERGFADRVRIVPTDFLAEPLPGDHDVHLFSNVLHDWDEPEVRHLLAASFGSLTPGGLIVIHDAFINADKSGPVAVAEYSALLMHASQGKCYSVGEYERMLRASGFEPLAYADTVADRGVMTAQRP